MKKSFAPDLTVRLGDLVLQNPVITASGTFGYGEEYREFMNLDRIGGLVTKAITLQPRQGNAPPRLVETAAGVLNAIGLANVGVEAFLSQKMPFLQKLKPAVIVNVAGSTIDEYVRVIERLETAAGIAALELNISCPNVREGGMSFGADPQAAHTVVKAARAATRRHLMVKLTPNVTDIAAIARSVVAAGADSLSVINTVQGMAIDAVSRRPRLKNVFGGLSGPAIKPLALACVYKVARAVRVPVVGGGGIMTGEDAVEFMIAGARAVSVGTVNFINPRAALDIAAGIAAFCRKEKIVQVADIVGTLHV
jgi:dihydroorotate dehydrogenase (NAD+) catalytic subunit